MLNSLFSVFGVCIPTVRGSAQRDVVFGQRTTGASRSRSLRLQLVQCTRLIGASRRRSWLEIPTYRNVQSDETAVRGDMHQRACVLFETHFARSLPSPVGWPLVFRARGQYEAVWCAVNKFSVAQCMAFTMS
ncbi:hypothetical protein K470DRAFT_160225 [Piedraia hortae CBS 480.64]|uniref:Uncharacterized protein n=1 Tax=Piedraia hortae CBS 480.64 TaxID=1314780 RepID=A0A6A7BRM3_9PEZI|nr:hypothetical protein K470DRAFT_160225 [Piedraia hortae CBS 480.64]